MRKHTLFAALGFLLPAVAFAQEPPESEYAPLPEYRVFGEPATESDAEAIETLIRSLGRAWGSQDVEGILAAYADDAEWTNAFGEVLRGHAELRAKFTELIEMFESDPDASGEDDGPAESESGAAERGSGPNPQRARISLRYLGSEAAVFHSFLEIDWGENRDGSGLRHVYFTHVLEKRGSEWLIVHEAIMDSRRSPYWE